MELSESAVAALLAQAPELAPLARHFPPKKIRGRAPGFASLVQVVVEQAVSQRSADAVWGRLQAAVPRVDPPALLAIGDGLRGVGLSGAKARCIVGIAEAVTSGELDLDRLEAASDDEVRRALVALRGLGRWTADIYLLLCLGRPDVWPAHDLALQEALRGLLGLEERPSAKAADGLGERYRPHRSAATLLLWERYLEARAPKA